MVIEVPPDAGGELFLGVHSLLNRQHLYDRCHGKGVEIGPGPKPQIHNNPGINVKYVEQASPDEWIALYGIDTAATVDRSLWDHYVVGNADSIPAASGELDFVFSSHVLEHLANPLGHLAYWGTLLKDRGVVAAIIPDKEGCKDFVFHTSTIKELKTEYESGSMDVTLEHYRRWGEQRLRGQSAEEIMQSGRSIHVHFYTPDFMRKLLAAFHKSLGYSSYSVTSSQNHKDFFIILEK